MLKLYRKQDASTDFWEAWSNGKHIVVHTGTVGARGTTQEFLLGQKDDSDSALMKLAKTSLDQGYAEIPDLCQLVLQRKIIGFGTDADLRLRHRMQDMLNETLGWTGNGNCDGGDMGSNTMNIFCFVVDMNLACQSIVHDFQPENMLAGWIIAGLSDPDGDYSVLWPSDFKGPFSTL